MEFELSKSKLFLYILVLLSYAFQTTARRAQMLPLPSDNFTTIPASNDIEPLLTNENPTIPSSNDTEPLLTNDNDTTTTNTHDTKPISHEVAPLSPQHFTSSPYSQEVAETTDDFFTPDVIQNPTSSPPQYFASSPYSQETAETNDDFFSLPATQNDMSSFYAPLNAPVPAPAATVDDDNILLSADLPGSANPPAPPVVDDSDDYNTEVAPASPLVVLPSTYEAEVEVDPELAEEIKAYTASQEDDDRQAWTAVVVAAVICLVGVGGFMYKKRKSGNVKKSQYQCLNRRDQN